MKRLRPTQQETLSAAVIIGKHLSPTRLSIQKGLSDIVGATIYVKEEYESPVRSFKARGALTLTEHLAAQGKISRVLTASTGNHGSAMAYACSQYGLPLTVGVPVGADESKVALIKKFGVDLEFIGRDLDETKKLMLRRSLPSGHVFIEDGDCPQIVAGTSTIGREIVRELSGIDMVLVPVGNGALIGGIGSAVKAFDASVKVIGVQSEGAPCMTLSFQAGKPLDTKELNTFATGMAVRVSIPTAVDLMFEVVDDMMLVSETDLKKAMGLFYTATGVLLEGAGAAALAGAVKIQDSIKDNRICLIASGSNLDDQLKQEIMEKFDPRSPRKSRSKP